MEKREKKKDIIIFGIVMAISLSVALNIGNIFGGVGTFIKIVNPILLGCMIAIILNVRWRRYQGYLRKCRER